MTWTVSLGQASDTVKCYNSTELRKIAKIVTQKNECEELLNVNYKRLEVQDSLIINYREQIATYKALAPLKDTAVFIQDLKIDNLESELKKTKRYWLYSSVGLFTLLLIAIL